MSRRFPNFLDAYIAWSADNFVPEQFNIWSGIAAVAGALERKVWLQWSETFSYYPNLFVLLVSLPGIGKSTALNKAVGLLKELQAREGQLNMLPNQVTEAKFIEMMGHSSSFDIAGKIYFQSAGFYWASEASNSFKPVYGDLIPCFTDFYDCPPYWKKATKKDNETGLENVALSLLAGSTFDYLAKLVTDENIMGGFASRLIYVVHREKLIRRQKFQLGGMNEAAFAKRIDYRDALMQDLSAIHKMKGPFAATPEFEAEWEKWYPEFEEKRQSIESEKMQSLLVRTNTNVLKVSMILSACESDERILKLHHWKKALELVETNSKDLPVIFQDAKSNDTQSQSGLNAAVLSKLRKGEIDLNVLRSNLMNKGFNPANIDQTLLFYKNSGKLRSVRMSGSAEIVKWSGNTSDEF